MQHRTLTEKQRQCLDRVAKNRAKATAQQLYRKDRYSVTECSVCAEFMTKDSMDRHWKNMAAKEEMHDTSVMHDLSIKKRYYNIDLR